MRNAHTRRGLSPSYDEYSEAGYNHGKGTHGWILVVAIAATITLIWVPLLWYFGFFAFIAQLTPTIIQFLNGGIGTTNEDLYYLIPGLVVSMILMYRGRHRVRHLTNRYFRK